MNNILFIMADQLRADALGFMKKLPVKTPNIDKLAERGTVFTNAYCTNPVCVPSRASLMTGVYSYDHGVYYNDQPWPDEMKTLPGQLSDNCYATVHVGKKHIWPERKAIGFDKLVLDSNETPFRRRYWKEKKQKAAPSWHTLDQLEPSFPLKPEDKPLAETTPVTRTDQALHELDLLTQRRECTAEGNEPFFLKLSYSKPHGPCHPPEPYFSMYDPNDFPPPVATEEELARFPAQLRTWYDIWNQLDDERKLKHRAQYYGCVTLVDDQIGRVIQKLEELGLYDNTLIVLTSDHGDAMCDHHLQQKAFFYDCMAKVPFIFSGPGIPEGHTVDENVSHIDLFPTLMDYCALDMPRRRSADGKLIYADAEERDAVSLIPYFCGEEEVQPDRIVISENAMFGQRFMLKKGAIKVNVYVNADGTMEFDYYDLNADPNELDNKGPDFTMDDFEPDMRAECERVLARMAEHADGHFYFQGKVRPMFT
jgi:arylsulfatase